MSSLLDKIKWYRARPGRFDEKIAELEALLHAPVELGGVLPPDLPASCFPLPLEQPRARRSVVAEGYKKRYAEAGDPRSCGDWLASKLAALCLEGEKRPTFNVAKFEALLTENGVRHEHWNRTTPGWQGRLRMSGRIALAKRIVEAGIFLVNGESREAPQSWLLAHGA